MRYVTYFFAWIACVLGVSYYYKGFWDIFFHAYYQDMDELLYGFTPAGMPEFNWKINLIIWLSGIILMGFIFWLVMDDVCKGQYKKRKPMPLWVIIVNQGAASALYLIIGVLSGYWDLFYYMPRFLIEIVGEALPSVSFANTDRLLFSLILHTAVFSALPLYFYFKERQHCHHILKREEEYRKELLEKGEL